MTPPSELSAERSMNENEETKERAWRECQMRLGTSCSNEMMSTLRRYFDAGWEAAGVPA